jgi:hypothetical protein
MSKDSETFEQLFRDRLYHNRVNPPSHIWTAISLRRKANAKREWLLLLLLVLLLLSTLALALLNQSAEKDGSIAFDSALESQLSSGLIENGNINTKNGYFSTEEGNLLATNGEDNQDGFEDDDFSSINKPSEGSGVFSSLASGQESSYATEHFAQGLNFSQENSGTVSESYGVSTHQNQSRGIEISIESSVQSEEEITNFNEAFQANQETDIELDAESIILETERSMLAENAVLSFLQQQSTGFLKSSKGKNQLKYEFDVCGVPRNPICFESRYPLRFFAIDVLAGPDFFDKLIQPQSREHQEYADMRLASESASFSYGAMLRFSAVFQNGLALRTGISINQINEKFTWKDPNAVNRRVVNVLIDTIINAPMDTTFVFDTLSIIESGTRVREIHNRYQMIDIPFLVGAEFHSGKWTFTSSLGVMFNIAFEKSGEILAENGDPIVINNQESGDEIFRSSLGLSFSGSFGVGYRISPQYSILVEPRVKYQLKPLTVDHYVLNQNYFIFGVHAGLRYKFK